MDRNLRKKKEGRLCWQYLCELEKLINQIDFATHGGEFWTCDFDVEWVRQMYDKATYATDNWFWKAALKVLKIRARYRKVYVRQLCLLDSVVALTSMEKFCQDQKQQCEMAVSAARGNDEESTAAREKSSKDLEIYATGLGDLRKTRRMLITKACSDPDEVVAMFAADLSDANICTDVVRIYVRKCKLNGKGFTLEAFGHRAMGGVSLGEVEASDVSPRFLNY